MIEQWYKLIDYDVTETYEPQWTIAEKWISLFHEDDCFHTTIDYHTVKKEIVSMSISDVDCKYRYVWYNPNYEIEICEYAKEHNIDLFLEKEPDDKIIKLETFDDIMDKANSIKLGLIPDSNVTLPIDISNSDLFLLMKQAHEKNITLNQHLTECIQYYIDESKDHVSE